MLKFPKIAFGYLAVTGTALLVANEVVQAANLLMVPDSVADKVVLFDAFDGSLVSENFIDGTGLFETPIERMRMRTMYSVWLT
jgi:hypothetical protein